MSIIANHPGGSSTVLRRRVPLTRARRHGFEADRSGVRRVKAPI
jgi:hypothetical protein